MTAASVTTSAVSATILLAHGSRDPLWRLPIEAVCQTMLQAQPHALVRCAYLELCAPSLDEAVADLLRCETTQIAIVPMFLGRGAHARTEIPRMVEQLQQRYSSVIFSLRPAIGEDARVTALLADIAANG